MQHTDTCTEIVMSPKKADYQVHAINNKTKHSWKEETGMADSSVVELLSTSWKALGFIPILKKQMSIAKVVREHLHRRWTQ